MKTMENHLHEGSSFDSFLQEDGTYEECTSVAIKRMLIWQLEEEMKKQSLTKNKMAHLMDTSRSQLDRLLDPDKTGVSLDTMQRAVSALGKELHITIT